VKVKTTKLAAGPNGVRHADTVIDVSEEEGRELIDSGAAVEYRTPKVEAASGEETATAEVRETTSKTTRRARAEKRVSRGGS